MACAWLWIVGVALHDPAMSELPEPKFRKTKSEKWAVMAPVETLEAALAGDGKVKVLKKSGDYSSFIVASLGKPFDVDGVQMCYGYAPGDDDDTPGSSPHRAAPTGRRSEPPPDTVRPASTPPLPPRDDSEPLPEYQGGADDEWSDGF